MECPENHSSFFPLHRPCWAQNCELVHSNLKDMKKEKRQPFVHLWLEKMKVHLYSLKDQSAERQVTRDTKLASVSVMLFQAWWIESNNPRWMPCFFPIAMFLVEPQSSKLPQTESLSSWHSFRVSLGGVNRSKALFFHSVLRQMRSWLSWLYDNLIQIKQAFLWWKAPLCFCVFYTSAVARAFGKRCIFWTPIPPLQSHREEPFLPFWKQMRMASRRR